MSKRARSSPHFRNIFLSDIHLGYKDCKAEALLQLLQSMTCDNLYLLGDIVDLWSLKRKPYWPPEHQRVIDKITALANSGTKVQYIPGNHDIELRDYLPLTIKNIEVCQSSRFVSQSGQSFLLIHGDLFDGLVRCPKLLTWLEDKLYDFLLFINRWFNWTRKLMGKPYWSLAQFIKQRIGKAQEYIDRYQQAALAYAEQKGYQGIICGHIHQPAISMQKGLYYLNCGDWIENCSFIVEDEHGELQLRYWYEKHIQQSTMPVQNVDTPLDKAA